MSTQTKLTPLRVLIPYDDSSSAKHAVQEALRLSSRGLPLDIHVLNVQPALRSDVTLFVAAENIQSFHRDEGMGVLKPALAILDAAGLPATAHVHVGAPAEVIAHVVSDLSVDVVLMGTHGRSALAELLLGSVAAGVVQAVRVPVMLVR